MTRDAQRALALEEILRELAVPLPLERTMDTIVKRSFELVSCDIAFITLHEAQQGEVFVAAAVGARHPGFLEARVPVGEGFSGMVFAARRPLHVWDYNADPRVKDSPFRGANDAEGIRSLLGVPIATAQDTLGVLCVGRRQVRPFEDDDIRLLQGLAYHAGVAIERVHLAERERAALSALAQANEELQRQYALLERLTAIHTRLTSVILEGGSLEGIASTLATALDCTVAIMTPSLQSLVLARAPDDGAAPTQALANVLEQMARDDQQERYRVVSLRPAPEGCRDVSRAVAPILAGKELLGYLCAMWHKRSFGEPELQALAHGAAAAALELLRQRARYEGQLHAKEDLLADLLMGGCASEAELKHRALSLGYRLDRPHVLLVLDIDTLSDQGPKPNAGEHSLQRLRQGLFSVVGDTLQRCGVEGLILTRRDGIVVALPLPEKDANPREFTRRLVEHIQQVAAQRLLNVSLSVGISRQCTAVGEFQQAHQAAQHALSVGKASGRPGSVLWYDDLRMYRVLFESKDAATLRAVTSDVLGPLLRLEPAKREALIETLTAFLQHNGSLKSSAAALYLHPHSLRYRLQRIERLLGADLQHAEIRLHLHLALRVHSFLESGVL